MAARGKARLGEPCGAAIYHPRDRRPAGSPPGQMTWASSGQPVGVVPAAVRAAGVRAACARGGGGLFRGELDG